MQHVWLILLLMLQPHMLEGVANVQEQLQWQYASNNSHY
jgi:hypothetical protein